MLIAVISDTHMPRGGRRLPGSCVERAGFQIFNPGSPTERRRATGHTMGLARVEGGAVAFELVALS